jgi:hypothetical protein
MYTFNYNTIIIRIIKKFRICKASWVLTVAKNQYVFINCATVILLMDSAWTTKRRHVNTHINVFQTYEKLFNFFNLTEVPFGI